MAEIGSLGRFRARIEGTGLRFLLGMTWVRDRLASARSRPVEGRTLDPDLAAMLRLDDFAGHSDLRGLSAARARRQVAYDILVIQKGVVPGVLVEDRGIPGPAGSLSVRIYTPDGCASPSPAVVYVHGGGWVTGSLSTHDGWCRRLAVGARVRVVSIEYRLAPEHRFPAAVDDSLAAFRWVAENAEALSIDPARIAVAGDSAGGNLSAVIARRAEGDRRPPALQVLLYPALDGTLRHRSYATFAEGYFLTRPMCEWYYDHYVGSGDRSHDDVSPLRAATLPRVPALVYPVGFDPLRDEAFDYAERMKQAGSRVLLRDFPDMLHGFIFYDGVSKAARAAGETIIGDIAAELWKA